jgi:AraC-like DNA-binding protein
MSMIEPGPRPGKSGRATHPASAAPGERRQRGVAPPKAGAANSTADRAIDILLLFSEDRPVWSVAEISEHFGMPRTTTYRYISSLRSYALIVEDASGGYRLGPKIFPLARVAKAGTSIITVASLHLEELNGAFGEAVTLYERIGHESIALDRFESRHRQGAAGERAARRAGGDLSAAGPGPLHRENHPIAEAAAHGAQEDPRRRLCL